jgi:hypothetical protein
VDFSLPLLREAEPQPGGFSAGFMQADVTQLSAFRDQLSAFSDQFSAISDQFSAISNQRSVNGGWSVITAFAVLHHIPSRELRLDILDTVRQLLKPGGLFIHSNWQFLNSEKLKSRIQDWSKAGLSADEVDPNDYLLDWRSGGRGLRYVHHFDEGELGGLAKAAGFQIKDAFYSDGETGNLALYQVWGK